MTVEVMSLLGSQGANGKLCSTFVLRYPRNIHGEFMTHRVFGRNASSSRAIPMKKMHQSIEEDPALPEKYTLNEPGMQGYQEASPEVIALAEEAISRHREMSLATSEYLAGLGLHKQIVNRYTEAHQHIRVVMTASELGNFFLLRTHETAEPTMQKLACEVRAAFVEMEHRPLQRGEWHLPYFDENEFEDLMCDLAVVREVTEKIEQAGMARVFPPYTGDRAIRRLLAIGISAARCARVSYNNFEGKRSGILEDIDLFMKLVVSQPIHASPLEHQATPDWQVPLSINSTGWANPRQHGNLVGWRQARKFIPGESGQLNG